MSSNVTASEMIGNTAHLIDLAEESICQAITQMEDLQKQLPKNKKGLKKLTELLIRSQAQLNRLSGVFQDDQQDLG